MKKLVVALGNEFRSDDGVGKNVIERLKVENHSFECQHHSGDPASLLELWEGRDVIFVDAANIKPVGKVEVFSPMKGQGDLRFLSTTSSHALSLAEAIELGKVLDKLPTSMTVYAVGAENFCPGRQLSSKLQAKVPELVERIIKENTHA